MLTFKDTYLVPTRSIPESLHCAHEPLRQLSFPRWHIHPLIHDPAWYPRDHSPQRRSPCLHLAVFPS